MTIRYIEQFYGIWRIHLDDSTTNYIAEVLTPVSINKLNEKDSIEIRFWESPQIFQLKESQKAFKEYYRTLEKAVMNETPIEIIHLPDNSEIQLLSEPNRLKHESFFNDLKEEELSSSIRKSELKDNIENETKLNEIFEFILKQDCTNDYDMDVCIPFYYKRDGCYARAHKMRYIIESKYRYRSLKVFTYDSKTPRRNNRNKTLAVRDDTSCIYWWYHVAPLVKCVINNEIKEFVIDPSVSDKPLQLKDWIKVQENLTCSSRAMVGSHEKRESAVYYPSGRTDDNYTKTDRTLRRYRKLISLT